MFVVFTQPPEVNFYDTLARCTQTFLFCFSRRHFIEY